MASELSHFQSLAEEALTHYEIEPVALTFIQHSGSIVYRVEDDTHRFQALRIHKPLYVFWAGEWQLPEAVRSEMQLRSFLYEQSDILVQQPIRTNTGDWIALVEDVHRYQVPCTLVSWLDGACADAALSVEQTEQAGFLLGRLHQRMKNWTPPGDFFRPHYDENHMQKALSRAKILEDRQVLSPGEYSRLVESVHRVIPVLSSLRQFGSNWGLIHGDYFPANLVFQNQTPGLIDFSECGFGHYWKDIGQCLLHLIPGRRKQFLEAYCSVCRLPNDAYRLAEVFMIVDCVYWLATVSLLPERYDKVRRLMPLVLGTYCRKYLSGESFLFG